jgi:adenylate cyclase
MADIFISYARPDRASIEKLAAALESEGFSVWWDRQIGGGAEFSQAIETELNAAKTVIVAWSEQSLGSHWVRDEADFARSQNKLLPISLDGALPPLGFRQLHSLDFCGWKESSSDVVFRELVQSLGSGQSPAAAVTTASAVAPQPGVASKPCVAVLPFANMSTDEEMEFIADGFTEDIITMLSSNRHLSVPARTSMFAFKGQSVDVRELKDSLGARYILEGSLRKIGQRVRVTVQLIAAESGEHIWAKKFDTAWEELLESPDDTVEKIAGSLFAQLTWAEADRSQHAPEETLGPWEYCQRSAARIGRAIGAVKTFRKGEAELELALELAPDYALTHALYSWCCNAAIINGIYEDDELADYVARAKYHLAKARELAQEDLLTLLYIGASENFAGMQERALHTLENVLARNPASSEAWYIICQVYAYLGRFDDARHAITRASELAPEAGFAPLHAWYRGLIEFLAGNYIEATPLIERKALESPEYGYVNILSAMCEACIGNEEAAQKYVARAQEHNPQLRPDKVAGMILAQFDQAKGQREYDTLKRLWTASSSGQ